VAELVTVSAEKGGIREVHHLIALLGDYRTAQAPAQPIYPTAANR
jgi:hypothetical protein